MSDLIGSEGLTLKDNNPTIDKSNDNNPHPSLTKQSSDRIDSDSDKNTLTKRRPTAEETERKFKDIPGRKLLIRILQIVGIVFSLIVVILSSVLLMYIGKSLGIITIVFACVAFIAFFFGIGFTYFYVKKVEDYLKTPSDVDKAEKIDQSWQRILLNIYFFLIMLCFVFFIIIGIGVLAFKDDIKLYIKGLAYNAVKWEDNFGDDTFTQVMSRMDTSVNCLGALGIIFAVFIVVALVFSLRLFNDYRKWQTVVQFICILYVLLGFICVYLGIYAFRVKGISDESDSVPTWIPTAMIAIAVIAIIIGLVGFFASFFENINFLKAFSIVVCVFTVVVLVIAIYGVVFVSKIGKYENATCNKLFLHLHETYLKEECGCDNKYVNLQFNLNSLETTCPKDRVIFAWEYETNDEHVVNETDERLYGCINQDCCFNTYSEIRSEFNYLVLIAFGLFGTGVLMIIGSVYMICKLKAGKEEGIHDKTTGKIMGIAAAVIVGVLIVFICLIPKQSDEADITNMKIDSVPKSYALANESLVVPQSKQIVKDDLLFKVREELKQTPITIKREPEQPVYTYTIEIIDKTIEGSFNTPQWPSGVDEVSTGDTKIYTFKSKDDYTTTFGEYITFVPTCPLTPNVLATFTISKTVNNVDTPVNSTEIDFSQVNSSPVEFSVSVKGGECGITITHELFADVCGDDYSHSDTLSTLTDTEAQHVVVVDKFYSLKTGSPIEYKLKLKPTNVNAYEQYETTFIIGGIGFTNKVDLGEIALVKIIPPVLPRNVTGVVLNAIDNSLLNDVDITIFKSMFDITSDMLTSEDNIKELLLSKGKQLAIDDDSLTLTTDDNGAFIITLNPGAYTILYNKKGFYFNLYAFELEDENGDDKELPSMPLTPEVEEGKIRIVLSWPDGPSDVDIHSMFKVTKIRKCHVYFGNKACTGVELDVDNTKGGKNGVETITINSLGNYVYTFYVHKYVDSTSGNADGETRTPSFTPTQNEYISDINAVKLYESKAKVVVYGAGYRAPIATFEVGTAPCDTEEQKEYKYWVLFCLNGSEGVSSLKGINELVEEAPSYSYCDEFY